MTVLTDGPVLVIGASGFVGGHLARALIENGLRVRALARNMSRVRDLAKIGCEIVQGDMSDAASITRASKGARAVYIAVHTISPQPESGPGQRFMAVEQAGLGNILAACRTNNVNRLIYITSHGVAESSKNEWLRERWRAEQAALGSGLNVTIIRPGMIVGFGGHGFDMVASNARRPIALGLAGGQAMNSIAVDDLTYYLTSVLDDARSFGRCFEVGNDDILTNRQMVDVVANVLGRKPPRKLAIPAWLLYAVAPLIERIAKLPEGAFSSLAQGVDDDVSGDREAIRAIAPRPLLTFREAAERALGAGKSKLAGEPRDSNLDMPDDGHRSLDKQARTQGAY